MQLEEKNKIYLSLKNEYEESERDYKNRLIIKDELIQSLRKELELIKLERNDKIGQMHGIYRENKFAKFNFRKSAVFNIYLDAFSSK